jgi:hypothetical protein
VAVEPLHLQERATGMNDDAAACALNAGQPGHGLQREVLAHEQVGPAPHCGRTVGTRELDQHVWRATAGQIAKRRELGELAGRAGAGHAGGERLLGQARVGAAQRARLQRLGRCELSGLPELAGRVAEDQVAARVRAAAAQNVELVVVGPVVRVARDRQRTMLRARELTAQVALRTHVVQQAREIL